MKLGNVSQTVLKRSVLKPLCGKEKVDGALFQPSVEEMCAGLRTEEGEQVVTAQSTKYGDEKDLGVFALAEAVNHVASRGAEAFGVTIMILLPPYAYESRLKSMSEYIKHACKEHGIAVLGAKAQVSPAVNTALVTVTAYGKVTEDALCESTMAEPGMDLVLTKWVAMEGMLRIYKQKEEELSTRFVPAFLHQIEKYDSELFAEKELKIARDFGAAAMHQITDGGVLAAIWELAEASGVGIEAELKKMSILQETIELCEYFHLNPYQMTSAGSVLIAVRGGEELVQMLKREGIMAAVIGRTTSERERVLIDGEGKHYLNRPAQDELLKMEN